MFSNLQSMSYEQTTKDERTEKKRVSVENDPIHDLKIERI